MSKASPDRWVFPCTLALAAVLATGGATGCKGSGRRGQTDGGGAGGSGAQAGDGGGGSSGAGGSSSSCGSKGGGTTVSGNVGCEFWPVRLENTETAGSSADALCRGGLPCAMVEAEVCAIGDGHTDLCEPYMSCGYAGGTCTKRTVQVVDSNRQIFTILVANPGTTGGKATLTMPDGSMKEADVPAGGVARFDVPPIVGTLYGPGIFDDSFRLRSTVPVVAYQFNPLEAKVYSNDGSMLMPSDRFGKDHWILTWPTMAYPGLRGVPSYFAVVASSEGKTKVTVTTSSKARAGKNTTAWAKGETREVELDQGQILNVQSWDPGTDLTGSRVQADKPVGVFAGHACAEVPSGESPCCCDHLEEQVPPLNRWGKTFPIGRSPARRDREHVDYIRVVASTAGTKVLFTPSASAECPLLGPGEVCQVKIDQDTLLEASEPVLVGLVLESNLGVMSPDEFIGDPALVYMPPAEQFRSDFTLMIPEFFGDDSVTVVMPKGGSITIDGAAVAPGDIKAFGDWERHRRPLEPGIHTVTCAPNCSTLVVGYGSAISYAFLGGVK